MVSIIEEHSETEANGKPEIDDRIFEFDAPQIKDFTNKEYQAQKKQIEKILETHGNPGVPQDPSKHQKPKLTKLNKPAPRKTFFSELFKNKTAKQNNKQPESNTPITGIPYEETDQNEQTDQTDQSVDDKWFEQREQQMDGYNEMAVHNVFPSTINNNPLITKDLFASDEERDILPQLKVIATPPIKKHKNQKGLDSAEFDPKEIEELSKSLAPLYYSQAMDK